MKKSNRISPVLLERLAQGELSDDRARALREKIHASGGDADAMLVSLRESDAEILQQLPPRVVAAQVQERMGRRKSLSTRRHWLALPIAATALGAWMMLARTPSVRQLDAVAPEMIGIRGMKTHLVIYRSGQGEPRRLSSEDKASPGDLIQIAYVVHTDEPGPQYGVIASIDDRSQVTLHLPATPVAAERLNTKHGEIRLPNAFELDATPGKERFVFVVSTTPFQALAVRDALLNRAPMPAGSHQTEFVLQKEKTR
ncbi:MAG: hypothetical protein SGI86_09720 [Deltaproteobacteria bacterium]|nr:hypothetical protein [Deltaproteobacteria bacterium]